MMVVVVCGVVLLALAEVEEGGYGESGDVFDVSEAVCPSRHRRSQCVQKIMKSQKKFEKDPNCCAKRDMGGCRRGVHVEYKSDDGCRGVDEHFVTTCCEDTDKLGPLLVILLATMLPACCLCVGAAFLARARRRRGPAAARRPEPSAPIVMGAVVVSVEEPTPDDLVAAGKHPVTATPVDQSGLPLAHAHPLHHIHHNDDHHHYYYGQGTHNRYNAGSNHNNDHHHLTRSSSASSTSSRWMLRGHHGFHDAQLHPL